MERLFHSKREVNEPEQDIHSTEETVITRNSDKGFTEESVALWEIPNRDA